MKPMPLKKKIIIAVVVIFFLLWLVYLFLLATKTGPFTQNIPLVPPSFLQGGVRPTIPPAQITQPAHTEINLENLKFLSPQSEIEISKIPDLPIYIKDFPTSKGNTTINIYRLPNEAPSLLHLEIYGPNYYFSEATTGNPHAIMYSEAFNEAKQQLLKLAIDPKKIIFVYGTRQYIHDTSAAWISAFNLLK